VCVTETNFEGCTGEPVCLEVVVEDDVWNVGETIDQPTIVAYPNPASNLIQFDVPQSWVGLNYGVFDSQSKLFITGTFASNQHAIDVVGFPSGQYVLITAEGDRELFQVVGRE